jgi:hypothetical protein
VLLQNFEVAPIINPLSEANQNWYSVEPCQSYQTDNGNRTVNATKKGFSEKTEKKKQKKKTTSFLNPETDPDRKPTFQQKPIPIPTDCQKSIPRGSSCYRFHMKTLQYFDYNFTLCILKVAVDFIWELTQEVYKNFMLIWVCAYLKLL